MSRESFVGFLAIFLLNFIVLNHAFNISDPQSCPKGMDAKTKEICCENFDYKMFEIDPFECCEYPRFVIWRWQFYSCLEQCGIPHNNTFINQKIYSRQRCCHFPCCLRYLKIIGDQPWRDGIDKEGFKFSYLLSVGNDTRWIDVINLSVDQCYTQYRQDIPPITNSSSSNSAFTPYEEFWDCFEMVPIYLYSITACVYCRNFLSCPVYNDNIPLCPEYKNYVQDCIVDITE